MPVGQPADLRQAGRASRGRAPTPTRMISEGGEIEQTVASGDGGHGPEYAPPCGRACTMGCPGTASSRRRLRHDPLPFSARAHDLPHSRHRRQSTPTASRCSRAEPSFVGRRGAHAAARPSCSSASATTTPSSAAARRASRRSCSRRATQPARRRPRRRRRRQHRHRGGHRISASPSSTRRRATRSPSPSCSSAR